MTELLPAETERPSARRTQTRRRLMTAAVQVFAERGIIGASVEEICEAAGFTRGAFYSNFSDRDELVVALLRHEMDTQYAAAEQALAALKSAATTGSSAEELVSIALTRFEEAGRAGRDWILTQQELLLYAARVPEVRDSYRAFSDECLKQFSVLIVDAITHAGREFSVSFPDAITLLTAAHQQVHLSALLAGEPVDLRPLGVLLLAISRPKSDLTSRA
jgi:AcrR family transcriptional regulator